MFNFFKERKLKRIVKYTDGAFQYVLQKYVDPTIVVEEKPIAETTEKPKDSGIRYSVSGTRLSEFEDDVLYSHRDTIRPVEEKKTSEDVRYSLKESKKEDPYNPAEVSRVLLNYSVACNVNEMNETLEQNVNQTFVDRLLYYISEKGLRDSKVYKAAQVDKRLFSKMVSNREYKPSKDTVIALAMALELSLDEANDMLSRAGYTLSHSSKRDIIIEFFFREEVYNLFDANEVLHRLNQKLIGRF